MIDLPWFKKDNVDIDLNKGLKILDEDHFGLEKVKERIIEFLAVQKRTGKNKRSNFMFSRTTWCRKNFIGKIHS